MRDPGVIDALDALERYARAFDDISRESDAPLLGAQLRSMGAARDDGTKGCRTQRVRGRAVEATLTR